MARWVWYLGLLALAGSMAAAADKLSLVTENNPPFNMLSLGKVRGIATDKVREMMTRSQIAYEVNLQPWEQAVQFAVAHANSCVFATARTHEREAQFKWIGPIATDYWMFYGRADRDYKLSSLADARAYLVGTYNGDVRDAFLRANGVRVDTALDDDSNVRKLMAGSIDLWAASKVKSGTVIARAGFGQQIIPLYNFGKTDLYLACNARIKPDVLAKLSAALAEMTRDGTVAAIESRYDH